MNTHCVPFAGIEPASEALQKIVDCAFREAFPIAGPINAPLLGTIEEVAEVVDHAGAAQASRLATDTDSGAHRVPANLGRFGRRQSSYAT